MADISSVYRGYTIKTAPDQLHKLPFEQKIGQLFFVGISGPEVDARTAQLIADISPGGICLFARNIKDPRQTRELLDTLRGSLQKIPFLSVDQEGGRVDRFRRIMPASPAASKFTSVDDVIEFAEITANALQLLGFNMDFAPVVDVIDDVRESAGNGLFSRSFGRNSADVVSFAGAFLKTLQKNGVIGCLKHFPGLGASGVDSHEELPQITISEDEIRNTDLFPYGELIPNKAEMVMVAHAAYPKVRLQERDRDGRLLPSTLSRNFVSELLRDELGFTGVAITDDLEMGAIVRNYGIGEACKMAVKAGNDMVAICSSESAMCEGFEAVSNAVASGDIPESRIDDSVERISRLKSKIASPVDFDIESLNEISDRLLKLNARLN
ncbi:MAG: hypothetical protein DMF62_05790 [Acidobacteria bacterium]|nr:MAG: hypothetical protein DMF62_05790 [Acidobacteriota bacterium]